MLRWVSPFNIAELWRSRRDISVTRQGEGEGVRKIGGKGGGGFAVVAVGCSRLPP